MSGSVPGAASSMGGCIFVTRGKEEDDIEK